MFWRRREHRDLWQLKRTDVASARRPRKPALVDIHGAGATIGERRATVRDPVGTCPPAPVTEVEGASGSDHEKATAASAAIALDQVIFAGK